VREHIDGARRLHVRATPTFYVNGVLQDISFGMQSLHDAVTDAAESVSA
jgi:protein-disulfide isomerase